MIYSENSLVLFISFACGHIIVQISIWGKDLITDGLTFFINVISAESVDNTSQGIILIILGNHTTLHMALFARTQIVIGNNSEKMILIFVQYSFSWRHDASIWRNDLPINTWIPSLFELNLFHSTHSSDLFHSLLISQLFKTRFSSVSSWSWTTFLSGLLNFDLLRIFLTVLRSRLDHPAGTYLSCIDFFFASFAAFTIFCSIFLKNFWRSFS